MGKAFNHSIEYLLMWIPHGLRTGGASLQGQISILIPQIPFPFILNFGKLMIKFRRRKEVFLWIIG